MKKPQMRRRRPTSATMEPVIKTTKDLKRSKQNNLRILPLGGNEESGRNLTVLEFDRDIIIIDAGIQFPTADMPGIDYVVPNVNYLKGKDKLIAIQDCKVINLKNNTLCSIRDLL